MKNITAITQKPIVMKIVTTMRILFFVLGVIMTISTSQIFKSCNKSEPVVADKSVFEPILAQASQQAAVIAGSDQRVVDLQTQNKQLVQQVESTKAVINDIRKRNQHIGSTLQQQVDSASILTDTVRRLSNCDSIANTAIELLQSCEQKDSLYEELAGNLEQQVINRDSIITVQDKKYNYLQLNYERTFAQQQLLFADNLQLQQQVKKHRIKNKLLSTGMLLLTGTATYLLLRH